MLVEKKIKETLLPYVRNIHTNNLKDYNMKVGSTNESYSFSKNNAQLVHKSEDFKWFSLDPRYEAFLAEGPMTNYRYNDIKDDLHKTLEWAQVNEIKTQTLK